MWIALLQILLILLVIAGWLVYSFFLAEDVDAARDYFLGYAVSDFGQVLYFTLSDNPYVTEFYTSYTPLCFLICLPFALVCKGNPLFYQLKAPLSEEAYNAAIVQTWEFWVAYCLYVLVFVAGLTLLTYKLLSPKIKDRFWLAMAVIFSNLGVFAISRGSNVQHILLLILVYLWLYRSEKAWQREIALVCLAAAGVCKYYPFIFGALLLREKDFWAALRVVGYSALLFFLPFFLFEGGVSNIPRYFWNLGWFVGGEERIAHGGNLSAYSLMSKILVGLGCEQGSPGVKTACLFTSLSVLAATAALTILSGSRFTQAMMCAAAMTLIPPVSYYYAVIFLIVPVYALAAEWERIKGWRRWFYVAFFAFCSFLPTLVMTNLLLQTLCYLASLVIEWVFFFRERRGKGTAEESLPEIEKGRAEEQSRQ